MLPWTFRKLYGEFLYTKYLTLFVRESYLLFTPYNTKQVLLSNRFKKTNGSECLLTVDGTDFQINEPTPFDPVWYSHKFHGAALRYEFGVSIQTGWLCWIAGPFPAGDFPDIEIFTLGLMNELEEGEKWRWMRGTQVTYL